MAKNTCGVTLATYLLKLPTFDTTRRVKIMDKERNTLLADKAKQLDRLYFVPWHRRGWRLKQPISKHYGTYEKFYDHLANEWIPGQPDFENLMQIFIILEFNVKAFLTLIITPPPKKRKFSKVA